MSVGSRIKELRKEKSWSQDEFAHEAGIDGRQVSRYENNKVTPSIEVIVKIATAFDVSVDYLLIEEAPRRALKAFADTEFSKRLPAVQGLSDEDRASLIRIIDALVSNTKMKNLVGEMG